MLWAQWTLIVLWVAGLALNLYKAGQKGGKGGGADGFASFLAFVFIGVIYFFAGAFDRIL
jgi:hypothetical protein